MKYKVKHFGQRQFNTRSNIYVKVNLMQDQTFRPTSMKYKVKPFGQDQ